MSAKGLVHAAQLVNRLILTNRSLTEPMKELKKLAGQGSFHGTHFEGIKQCKYMVILRDFHLNSALFGLVI